MISESTYNALKKYRGGFYTGPTFNDELKYFSKKEYIKPLSREIKESPGHFSMNPTEWIITLCGEDALSEFEYIRENDAENKRNNRFNRKISVINVLVPFVTFICGALLEHFSGIFEYICTIFQ